MIDVHRLTGHIIDANRAPVPGNVALGMAIRVTTEALAQCWDDCTASLPPKMRDADAPNPYRLALELTPDAPFAARDEPDDDEPEPNPRYAGWQDVNVVNVTEGKSNPERDDRQRHVFVTTTDDAELIAMQIVVQALEGLEPRTQERIIRYVSERMA